MTGLGKKRPAGRAAPEITSHAASLPNARRRFTAGSPEPSSRSIHDDERLAVTLTVGELRRLVTDAALDAVADRAPTGPALLDRVGLARALDISPATVDRLRRQGCPMIRIGDSPRFELTACLEWLRRSQPEPTGNEVDHEP